MKRNIMTSPNSNSRETTNRIVQAGLAQSVEHGTLNPRVVGSSPTLGRKYFKISITTYNLTYDGLEYS